MAGNRTIQILINALTNTKGFDDAQKGLVDLALQAKAAGIGMDGAGKSARHMGEEMGGKRGQVADLTRVLLMQIGATEGAGEAAKLAGIGLNFMSGAATGLNIGMAGATAAIAFVVPLLLDWKDKTKDVSSAHDLLKNSLLEIDTALPGLIRDIPEMSKEWAGLAKAIHDVQMEKEAGEADAVSKSVESLKEQLSKVGPPLLSWLNIFRVMHPHMADFASEADRDAAAADDLRKAIALNQAALKKHDEAVAAGLTIGELQARDKKSGEEAQRKATKATEDATRAQEEWEKSAIKGKDLGTNFALALKLAGQSLNEAFRTPELGALSQELFDFLTTPPPLADEMGVALRNLGIDLAGLQGRLEDVDAAFLEAQDLFEKGIISPKTLQKTNEAILATIDNLRQMGIAVQGPFTAAQELILNIQANLEEGLFNAGSQWAQTMAGALTGLKTSWTAFAREVIRDLIAMILKAVAFRAIMTFLSFVGGGAGAAAGAGAGITIGGGIVGMAQGGLVMGGIPGEDSVLAWLKAGEIVLPQPVAQAFQETQAQARDDRDMRAGRAASVGPSMAMAVQILPQRDKEREAVDLLDEINRLVERRGYRLVASTVKS